MSTVNSTPTYFMRHEDWPERLEAYLRSIAARPFVWGEHDCALFAADAVREMTGVDLAEDFRGRYSSLFGARHQFARNNVATFDGLVGTVVRRFHVNEIPPGLAQRGDMVMFDGTNGAQLGIVDCDGRRIAALAEAGLAYVSIRLARRAWAIGRVM